MPTKRRRLDPLPTGEKLLSPAPLLSRSPALLLSTAITLLAAALRFLNLGYDSLWFDEVLTRQTAAAGFAAALAVRDHVPLLYWLTTAETASTPARAETRRSVTSCSGKRRRAAVVNQ